MDPAIASHTVRVDGLRLHYLEAGEGAPVVLLHGWPTSSFLWRHVMPPIATHQRVIALDLPGFGKSDKPLDASYSFRYYDKVLNGFFDTLGITETGLAVHDLGGPIGLYWGCQNPQRVRRLALLNTLVYPEASWAVVAFVLALKIPMSRSILTTPWGLKMALRIGVADSRRLTEEAVRGTQEPFADRSARRALIKAGIHLSPKGFQDIARILPTLECPVRVIYGEKDRILPDVARTMARIRKDLPQTEITSLPDCGHFLQEERPQEIGNLLAEFFADSATSS